MRKNKAIIKRKRRQDKKKAIKKAEIKKFSGSSGGGIIQIGYCNGIDEPEILFDRTEEWKETLK